ncbi:hypothetical protein WDW86_07380 [Bdellovibrionota bacterium FG-2]
MRITLLLNFFAVLLVSTVSQASSTQTITQEDVVKKVSSENYEVLENALRVYQAKEAIEVARGNLLPRLNLWKVAGVVADTVMQNYGGAAMGLIEDVAPFLIPANWFRLKEAQILFLAEKEGYRALWANEVMTAKGLYFHSLLDQSVLEHVNMNIGELEELLLIVSTREILGGASDGGSRDIETRILSLKEDRRALEVLVLEETNLLSFMMGFPNEIEVALTPIPLPDFNSFEPLQYEDFEFRAIDSSPEVRQFDHFIAASEYVRKEVTYSFLGGSSMSRGLNGGAFDMLPSQVGLGFGTGASMRIVDSQKSVLQIQQRAVTETLRRQLKLLIENYNLDLANYADLSRHADLTELTQKQLYERLGLGENIEMLMLVEASRNHIQAETALFAVHYRFLLNEDKLKRMIFQGDYFKEPAAIELVTQRVRGQK